MRRKKGMFGPARDITSMGRANNPAELKRTDNESSYRHGHVDVVHLRSITHEMHSRYAIVFAAALPHVESSRV